MLLGRVRKEVQAIARLKEIIAEGKRARERKWGWREGLLARGGTDS